MADDRPAWARRMYNERQARGWSQADAIRAMRAHSGQGAAQHVQPAAAIQAVGSGRGHPEGVLPSRSSPRRSAP